MTIDAVLVAMFNLLPYKINLKTQEKDLEELYERVSNTTEPILSLDIVKKNFDISKYEVNTHNRQLQAISEHPHSVDIHMLMRLCNVYDIPLATNYATATRLIKSEK
jgi:hypothetical protein